MLKSRRSANVFVIILVKFESHRNLIFDFKDLNKKKFLYI